MSAARDLLSKYQHVIDELTFVTGDKGVFDMKTNTITLMGNVVVSQGQNVLRGQRLVVDRVTGVSRMEGGRVQGIFQRGPKEEGSPGMKMPGTN